MMLSPEQIRAARAMLEWTQSTLAEQTGLSPNTIHSLEKGNLSLRSSMEVRKLFESKGFEFVGKNGVIRRTCEHRIFDGPDGCDKFYADILATAKEKGCEIVATLHSQEMLIRALGDSTDGACERWEQLGKFARVKCLLSETRPLAFVMPSFEFRATPQNPLGSVALPSFIYDDKIVLLVMNGGDFFYFLIKSVDTAVNGQKSFAALWNAAVPLVVPAEAQKAA